MFDRVAFWQDPPNYANGVTRKLRKFSDPAFYLDKTGFTNLALSSFIKYAQKDWSFLELGCGTGRTLAAMKKAGFDRVCGLEINPNAISLGKQTFPELKDVTMLCGSIETQLGMLEDFDVIFTVGVFMHLPYSLDWIFKIVANKARKLILTGENEMETDFFKWRRNYKAIFENLGWSQIEEETGANYPPIPDTTIKRVFTRKAL